MEQSPDVFLGTYLALAITSNTDIPIDDLIEALIARARPNSATQELVKPRFKVYQRELPAVASPDKLIDQLKGVKIRKSGVS
jgi:hypothetical protein